MHTSKYCIWVLCIVCTRLAWNPLWNPCPKYLELCALETFAPVALTLMCPICLWSWCVDLLQASWRLAYPSQGPASNISSSLLDPCRWSSSPYLVSTVGDIHQHAWRCSTRSSIVSQPASPAGTMFSSVVRDSTTVVFSAAQTSWDHMKHILCLNAGKSTTRHYLHIQCRRYVSISSISVSSQTTKCFPQYSVFHGMWSPYVVMTIVALHISNGCASSPEKNSFLSSGMNFASLHADS